MFCNIQITHKWYGWQRETVSVYKGLEGAFIVQMNVCTECGKIKMKKLQ